MRLWFAATATRLIISGHLAEVWVGRFVVPLVFIAISVASDTAFARGGPLHLFDLATRHSKYFAVGIAQ